MNHVTHMNEPCHAYEWVVSGIWMSCVTHINESCHAYKWGMSCIWMRHVTHMNESCHAYKWVMSRIWMSHFTHMNESWHTYKWGKPCIWMSHVAHTNEACHAYEWGMSRIWMRHITHGWVISLRSESCHIWWLATKKEENVCTSERVIQKRFNILVVHLVVSQRVMSHVDEAWDIWMSHVTHMNESCHTYEWVHLVVSQRVMPQMIGKIRKNLH